MLNAPAFDLKLAARTIIFETFEIEKNWLGVYFLTHKYARCLGFKGLNNLNRNNDLGRSRFPSPATLRVGFIKKWFAM